MKAKGNNRIGIKFLLTTFSLTLVLGFWNLFAKKSQAELAPPAEDSPSAEPWDEAVSEFALPTLVPLEWTNLNSNAPINDAENEIMTEDIREVAAPTPRPVIQQQAPLIGTGSDGQQQESQSPQQPRPQPTSVTTTGSSK